MAIWSCFAEIADAHGLRVAAISNEGRELALHRIRKFHLAEFMDFFIISSFVRFRKPDEDIFRLALDIAQVRPEQAVYIDDRLLFVEVAQGLGIRSIYHEDLESTCNVAGGARPDPARIVRAPMTDALTVDRLQFATTITFHYLFAQLTMGLAFLIVLFGTLGYRRRDENYQRAAHFWTAIFAITFAFGVATGVPMEFQFGTNWANFSQFAGGVIGQTLALEGVFAFFLESSFLGVMLAGEKRVGPRLFWASAADRLFRGVALGVFHPGDQCLDAVPGRLSRRRRWDRPARELLSPADQSLAALAVHAQPVCRGGHRLVRGRRDRRVLRAVAQASGTGPALSPRGTDRRGGGQLPAAVSHGGS